MTDQNVRLNGRLAASSNEKPANAIATQGPRRNRSLMVLASVLATQLLIDPSAAQVAAQRPATYPALPSETPNAFEAATDSFDYVRRNVMIPMRDGVKLHTVVLVPRGAKGAPILLTRTPYNSTALTSHSQS